LIVVATTLLSVTVSSLAGYAFAAFRFPGREALFWLFLSGIMITRYALFVPLFVVLSRLGLRGIPALVLSSAFDPMGIYWFRNYMASHVPGSYCESARLDGAGELQILGHIMAPLCTPIVASLIVYKAVVTMQDYVWQMIVLLREDWYTLMLGLARAAFTTQIQDGYSADYSMEATSSMLMLLPLILIFAFTSKYFIKGIGDGGVKE
jgi:ABC-type glycerol-3-phosphate transport system permease component